MNLNIRDSVLMQMEEKIAAGEALAAAVEAEAQAQAALDEAVANAARARQAAQRAGWTEAELKKLGLVPGTRSARGRQVRSGSSKTDAASSDEHA